MGRGKRGSPVHGVVLLDKPSGPSSNHSLQRVKRLFDAAKAGHTGNLDPFATGMLPICLGEASKTAGFLLDSDKRYRATARLGVETDTGDLDGRVVRETAVPALDERQVNRVLSDFTGQIEQVPPMYSALKHQGQPLYKLARAGQIVDRKPRLVHIESIVLESLEEDLLVFQVHCSKGTYVRTLASDIAGALGTCAHLVALRRLDVGAFSGYPMHTLEVLETAAQAGCIGRYLLPVDAGLRDWPRQDLDAGLSAGFRHGNPVSVEAGVTGNVRVYGDQGQLLGLGTIDDGGQLRPRRVFNLDPADMVSSRA